jgi:hypothetical protein
VAWQRQSSPTCRFFLDTTERPQDLIRRPIRWLLVFIQFHKSNEALRSDLDEDASGAPGFGHHFHRSSANPISLGRLAIRLLDIFFHALTRLSLTTPASTATFIGASPFDPHNR